MTRLSLISYIICILIALIVMGCMQPIWIKIVMQSVITFAIHTLWWRELCTYRGYLAQTLARQVPPRFWRYVHQIVQRVSPSSDAVWFVRILLILPIPLTYFDQNTTIMAIVVAIAMIVALIMNYAIIIPMYREHVATAVVDQLLLISCDSHPPATSHEGQESLATNPEPSSSSPDAPLQ